MPLRRGALVELLRDVRLSHCQRGTAMTPDILSIFTETEEAIAAWLRTVPVKSVSNCKLCFVGVRHADCLRARACECFKNRTQHSAGHCNFVQFAVRKGLQGGVAA